MTAIAAGEQSKSQPLTYREAAVQILRERGPMHYRELVERAVLEGILQPDGATPAASLNAILSMDIKRLGKKSEFIRVGPGIFGLRAIHGEVSTVSTDRPEDADETVDGDDEDDLRVRIPVYPSYDELRQLLRIWPGYARKQITGFHAAVNELRGTPKNTVDWSDPDTWIPQRLRDDARALADDIWKKSKKSVNPRYTYAHWLLAQRYDLIQDENDGVLKLTEKGRDFLQNKGGETEVALDEAEGLLKLLAIIADNGPARPGGLIAEWSDYLSRRSRLRSDSTIRESLRRRLSNLVERDLAERKGGLYSLSQKGLEYLGRNGDEDSGGGREHFEIWALVRKQEMEIRESLRELIGDLDPFAFEHLIKELLREMGYQNAEVTVRSGDGGVDVVADIELGITSVREVVQVKKHQRRIQRKDLDALNAVRGTIITTSQFAKGTMEAAFAPGVAPITLIDGNKLLDLLIEHGVGVRKRNIELLELNPGAFENLRDEA